MPEGTWPVLLSLAAALLAWPAPGTPAHRRVRALGLLPRAAWAGPAARPPPSARTLPATTPSGKALDAEDPGAARRRRQWLAGGVGLASALLVGGVLGLLAGAAIAAGVERLLRRGADESHRTASALGRDLPGACDLLAVCLAAGTTVGGALAAVGAAVPAPLGQHLCAVAGLYRLGAEPRRAWTDVPAELAGLGRVLVRAGESGSAVALALRALAADCRAAARSATEADVRRAGVWVLAPLGLCFLPAFVCLGVVPLVLGIAGDVFG